MKIIYQHLPTIEIGGLKLVGVVLFGLLVLLSAAVGATAGLLLVYSTDLPQVEELERYRPSSVTELYDGQSRVIGTFALQRRLTARGTAQSAAILLADYTSGTRHQAAQPRAQCHA